MILGILLLAAAATTTLFSVIVKGKIDYNKEVPKIVHLIYIPWKNNILIDNHLDYDHTYATKLEKKYRLRGWMVKMWDREELDIFLEEKYPEFTIPKLERLVARPTQLIDFYRWLVVAHYGGIYLQYGSVVRKTLDRLMPSPNSEVRLFTEAEISEDEAHSIGIKNQIRNGRPEERIRVANQVFSAVPSNRFLWTVVSLLHSRLLSFPKPKNDYEVLYHGATAFISELWDTMGRHDGKVELLCWKESIKFVEIVSKGSWRTDDDNNK